MTTTTTTTPAPSTFPSPAQVAALSMVGRIVTDGLRVGVMRSANGPDWFVVQGADGAVQLHTDPQVWAPSPTPQCEVKWSGATWNSVLPLGDVRKGVTLFKAYGLPRF